MCMCVYIYIHIYVYVYIYIYIYILLGIKWITNKNILYSTGQKKKVQSICKTYIKLTLKMHSSIH